MKSEVMVKVYCGFIIINVRLPVHFLLFLILSLFANISSSWKENNQILLLRYIRLLLLLVLPSTLQIHISSHIKSTICPFLLLPFTVGWSISGTYPVARTETVMVISSFVPSRPPPRRFCCRFHTVGGSFSLTEITTICHFHVPRTEIWNKRKRRSDVKRDGENRQEIHKVAVLGVCWCCSFNCCPFVTITCYRRVIANLNQIVQLYGHKQSRVYFCRFGNIPWPPRTMLLVEDRRRLIIRTNLD